MPTYDYVCRECGQRKPDIFYTSYKHMERTIPCSCGGQMGLDWSGTRNFIHQTHSGLYGRPEPALGYDCFQSYEHKKRLLKEWDMEEASDPVKGARLYRKEKPPKANVGKAEWSDDLATHM